MLSDWGCIGEHLGTRASLREGGSAQSPRQRGNRHRNRASQWTQGYSPEKAEGFHVDVVNELKVPTSIHWHGLILPNLMDGVPFVTQNPIAPGKSFRYDFPLKQSGT
jgi:FtsP/CotA-like multicopper oxidase with cupredoxin domain